MKFKLTTKVDSNYRSVYNNFDKNLFSKLSPPFPILNIKIFEGSKKNDKVHVTLDFIFFKQDWISIITDFYLDLEEIFFIDEGIKLPFFLKFWKHKHRILSINKNKSYIIDEIEYKTFNKLFDYLIFPIMYLQFFYRKPIYKNFFKNL
jgi:ligand-binding SRPBCC domain-containing protein